MSAARLLPGIALLVAMAAAGAEEPDRGELLYQNHCTACHESTVHVRDHSKAKSLADLEGWVQRWSDYLKLGWGNDERGAVRDYLNLTYYGFFDTEAPAPPAQPR